VVQDAFLETAGGPFPAAAQFKKDVVAALAPAVTAVLLDPHFGAGPMLADNSLPGGLGLVVSVEKSGFEGPSNDRLSRLSQEWSVEKIKRMGASAVKLLVYYHPDGSHAAATRELVARVAEDCRQFDLSLFLEPLSYTLAAGVRPSPRERQEVVVRTAAELSPLGADILKVEFPTDAEQEQDEAAWVQACSELDSAAAIPWVLLSAAVDYEIFLRQAAIACQAGASGILAGRAIWKEALKLGGVERRRFLEGTALERMECLRTTCSQYGRPYHQWLDAAPAQEDWPEGYPGF
jgi:tagatose-1,6-bisphosphate aldolase